MPGSRGKRLTYRYWEAAKPPENKGGNGSRLGSVSIVHGLGDHSGRYEELSSFLLDYSTEIFALDHHGFGMSEGKRGDGYIEDYLADQKKLHGLFGSSEKNLLIGQSLGGLLCLAYLQSNPDDYDFAIILSPALSPERDVPLHLRVISKFMNISAPGLGFSNRIASSQLSHDEERVESLRNDGLSHSRITPRLFEGMCRLSREVWEGRDRINRNMKILFVHGTDDGITSPGDTEKFFNTMPVQDKQLSIIPGMRHETLNETERLRTYSILSAWLERVLNRVGEGD